MASAILGISAFYHDSAAALLVDGRLVAAAQEERFSRIKHDPAFPAAALEYVLKEAGLEIADLDAVAFYDKPLLKFERLLETAHALAPRGGRMFLSAMPVWVRDKLFLRRRLREGLAKFGPGRPKLLFPEHHLSHAASAFYPSPFAEAAVLTVDGVGEWATTTIGYGQEQGITVLRELEFPHSLGLLYSAFTQYCGFRVNDGEYKLMGLAPYAESDSPEVHRLIELILSQMVDLRADGSFLLNMDYFSFATGNTMCDVRAWQKLLGIPARRPDEELREDQVFLALAIQRVTEQVLLRLAETAKALTGCERLVMAGGVALNCVANARLRRSGLFRDVWVQPAAGDAGGALGAALASWQIWAGGKRSEPQVDFMQGCLLGPDFSDNEILRALRRAGLPVPLRLTEPELCETTARLLAAGQVVGWFQGRMEYGPRALGNRSILADPRVPDMQRRLNQKIKFREGFRPFAPAVLADMAGDWFDLDHSSPYMLFTAPVVGSRRKELPSGHAELPWRDKLAVARSDLPAVTHVDYSARVQTVDGQHNPLFFELLGAFRKLTGCPVLVNTSFNVKDEPIVCTPDDAVRCFLNTDIDVLVMGNRLLDKAATTLDRQERSVPVEEQATASAKKL